MQPQLNLVNNENIHHMIRTVQISYFALFYSLPKWTSLYFFALYLYFINEILYRVILDCSGDSAGFEGEVGCTSKELCKD